MNIQMDWFHFDKRFKTRFICWWDTMKLTSVEQPKLPPELIGTFNEDEWYRVYINGVLIPKVKYNVVYQDNTDEIYLIFQQVLYQKVEHTQLIYNQQQLI